MSTLNFAQDGLIGLLDLSEVFGRATVIWVGFGRQGPVSGLDHLYRSARKQVQNLVGSLGRRLESVEELSSILESIFVLSDSYLKMIRQLRVVDVSEVTTSPRHHQFDSTLVDRPALLVAVVGAIRRGLDPRLQQVLEPPVVSKHQWAELATRIKQYD